MLLSLSLPRSLLLSSVPTTTMRKTSSATLHMKDHSKMENLKKFPCKFGLNNIWRNLTGFCNLESDKQCLPYQICPKSQLRMVWELIAQTILKDELDSAWPISLLIKQFCEKLSVTKVKKNKINNLWDFWMGFRCCWMQRENINQVL